MPAPDEDFAIMQTNFGNGISSPSADKDWLPNTGHFTRNLAIFDNVNYVTLNPAPIKDSGSVVTDLVRWIEAGYPWENARYAYGGSGNVYHIDSGNNWTVDQTLSNSQANGMVNLGNAMYFATNTNIVVKQNISSGSGVYNSTTVFGTGFANPQNLDISVNASGNTYTAPSTITEDANDSLTFGGLTTGYNLFAYDPIKSIAIKVAAVGTGNWILTFHDSFNNNLGSVTVANGSMTTGAFEFTFATPIRVLLGATYHVHVTTTTGDGTVTTTTSANLSTAWVQTFYGVLVSNQYHPMMQFSNGVSGIFVVGNDSYLGTYDGITYNPNKIRLEPGYIVRALARINQNIVAYCTKGTNLQTYEYGRAYVWDGIQPYYLLALPLSMGMPNTAINFKNRLLGIFGVNGDMSISPDETQPFRQVQSAPKLTKGYIQTTEPGAIAVWQRRCLFSYAGANDANAGQYNDPSSGNHSAGDTYTPPTGLEPGVYEFGNQSDREITYTAVSTEVMNFAYQPSQAIVAPTNFVVGCIMPFGNDLYISYEDNNSNFYVDRINKGNGPVGTGSWESLINDKGLDKYGQFQALPHKKKLGVRIRVTFLALPTGATVTAKYRLDRASAWTFGKTSVAGSTSAVALIGSISGLRYKEIEYGFDITATSNYPYITSVGLFFKPLTEETLSGYTL